jgi:hypothetical protein
MDKTTLLASARLKSFGAALADLACKAVINFGMAGHRCLLQVMD